MKRSILMCKGIIRLCAAVAVLAASTFASSFTATRSASALTSGIVATNLALNLDPNISDSYSGTGTTVTDLSGANRHGTFAGSTLPGWVLLLWIVTVGTIVPYLFVISGLRLLSASTSSVIGMLEPVFAGIFAWMWLQQSWNGIQLIGATVVLVGIYIADRARSAAI